MARGTNSVGVKKSASTNGVQKAKKSVKKVPAAASSDDEVAVVEVVGEDSVSDTSAPVKNVVKAKKAKRSVRVTESSSGAAGGRVRKAPERYEAINPPQGPTKKARTGNAKEFPVEAIRGIKKESGSFSFLVKWEGYAEKSNNWEPESNVRMCKSNIQKFLDQVSKHVNGFP